MTQQRRTILLTLGLLGSLGLHQARADVKLPALFSDHMVLQRDMAVPVWGWADPGETVTLNIAGQTKTATADAKGKWSVKMEKLSAQEPVTLTVKGKNTVTVQDVLIGEVWLAAGQSNMQLPVSAVTNAWVEKASAKFPQIRMFTVARHPAVTPQSDCEGEWIVCSLETVPNFSAAAYFFGRDLHQKLGAPVGLINASWGSTPIETWTSLPVQEGKKELEPIFAEWNQKVSVPFDEAKAKAQYERQMKAWKVNVQKAKAAGKAAPWTPKMAVPPRQEKNYPANLFNGMIAPLIPYAIRGGIWYQGENNSRTEQLARTYAMQLPLMIQDWRARWNEGDFPFAWVQLPNFKQPTEDPNAPSNWSFTREAMLKALALPNTGMAITIDVGEAAAIHPRDKQTVGKRLALWARSQVYGEKIPFSGPLPAGHKIKGDEVTLSFTHTDGGLVAKGGELKGFAIAGSDQKWVWAKARIEGDKVIVSSPDVKSPVAVRYGWAENPDCNLYNGAGLPASPFRTDDW
ncbi:MAG: sialate O-acetylesterase [Verrucomicrobiota bacterium]